MQHQIERLVTTLKANPVDDKAAKELTRLCAEDGAWDDLYAAWTEIADYVDDADAAGILWLELIDVIDAHAAAAKDDPILQAQLLLRSGDIFRARLDDADAAAERYRSAFQAFPDAAALSRAADLFSAPEHRDFAERVVEQAVQLAANDDERIDALARLVRLRLANGDDRGAVLAFGALEQMAADDERVVTLRDELPAREEAPEEDAAALQASYEQNPGDDGLASRVADALRGADATEELIAHLERWRERTTEAAAQHRIERDLGLLYAADPKRAAEGMELLGRAFARQPDDEELRSALAGAYRESGDWEALRDLYGKARAVVRDRAVERTLLLEEGRLLWRELEDMEGAERLFRRLRAHPEVAGEALAFYEDYYADQKDWRRLYSTLAQRQGEVTGDERIEIGVRMARVADEQMQQPEKAIESWKRILSWDPDQSDALAALPELYERTGTWHALLEFLNARVARLPEETTEDKLSLLRQIVEIYGSPEKLNVPEMAIHTYGRILQIAPDDEEAIKALCERYAEARRWSELVEVLERQATATDDPEERRALLRRIATVATDEMSNPARAVPALEAILETDPADREALDALRETHKAKHATEALYDVNQRLLDIVEGDERIALLREQAELAAERLRRHDEAIAHWEEVLGAVPGDGAAVEALQRLYARSEAWDAYVDLLGRQLAEVDDSEERIALQRKLGQVVFDRLRDHERAKEIFTEVAEAAPEDDTARAYLRKIHVLQQSWGELEELYGAGGSEDWKSYIGLLNEQQERESDPDVKVELNLQIARIYEERLEDPLRALQRYERVRRVAPENVDIARILARLYEERRDRQKLREVLGTLAGHSLDPVERREAQQKLIDIATKKKDWAAAFGWAAQALVFDLEAGRLEMLEELESLAEKAGDFEGLAERLEEAEPSATTDTARRALLIALGRVCKERLHDFDRAGDVLERAVDVSGGDPTVLDELEELYLASSNFEGLESVLRKRIDLVDDPAVAREHILKLAQMYEDVLDDSIGAAECYERLVAVDEHDRDAVAGLKRVYEREERWIDLRRVLETELSALETPEERLNHRFQLARLVEQKIESVEEAVEIYCAVLEEDPKHQGALDALDVLFADEDNRSFVVPVLEPIYRDAGRWDDLVMVLQAKAELILAPEVRLEVQGEIATIHEKRRQDPHRAYATRRGMFAEAPAVQETWDELERLAEVGDLWSDLAGAYAAALSFEPGAPADPGAIQSVGDPSAEVALLRRLARIYEESLGDLERAGLAHQRILDLQPDDVEALDALAGLYETAESWEPLLEVLDRKAEIASELAEARPAYLKMSQVLREHLDREEDAIEIYERLRALDDTALDVLEELEGLYLRHERWEELVALLGDKLERVEDANEKAEAQLALGAILRDRTGDPERAVDLFIAALNTPEYGTEARAALETMLRNREAAGYEIYAGRVADVLEPVFVEAEDWDALADLLTARIELAADDLERATLYRRLGKLHEDRREEPQRAFSHYCQAFMFNPGDDANSEDLERLAEDLQAWRAYADILERGLEDADPGAAVATLERVASIYEERLDDDERATAFYEQLVETDPTALAGLTALDRLYQRAEQPEKRVEVLRQLVVLVDEDEGRIRDLWLEIGRAEGASEHVDEAIEAFRNALEHVSDHEGPIAAEANGQLEVLYELTERWDDLIQLLLTRAEHAQASEARNTLLYRAAMVYEEHKDAPEDAIELYRRVLAKDGRDDVARAALRRLYRESERWAELEALLTDELSFVDSDEDRVEVLLLLALLYEDQLADPSRALGRYRDLVTLDPSSESALAGLGRLMEDPDAGYEASRLLVEAYRGEEAFEELATVYEAQIERFDTHVDVVETLFSLAELQEERFGDDEAAFETYGRVFRERPDEPRAWDALVRLAKSGDRWEAFFGLADEVVASVPSVEDRIALRQKTAAIHQSERGDAESAESLFWDNLADEPHHAESLVALEELYIATERWDRLADVLRRNLEGTLAAAEATELRRRLGRLYQEELDDQDEAAQVFEDILAADPGDRESLDRLESIHANREDWDASIAVLERKVAALGKPAEVADVLRAMAHIHYVERKDPEAAVDALERLMIQTPEDEDAVALLEGFYDEGQLRGRIATLLEPIYLQREAWESLVRLYLGQIERDELNDEQREARLRSVLDIQLERLDDTEGGLSTLIELLRRVPEDEALHDKAAAIARVVGGFPRVAELYTELLDDGLDDAIVAAVAMRLAGIQENQLGQSEQAVETYRQVLALQPENPDALPALERLLAAREDWPALVELQRHLAAHSLEPEREAEARLRAAGILRDRLADPAGAADELRAVVDLLPDKGEAYEQSEPLLRELGDLDGLEELYQRWMTATSEEETRLDVRLRLVKLYVERGRDVAEIAEMFRTILEAAPAHEETIAYVRSLLDTLPREPETAALRSELVDILELVYDEETPADAWVELHMVQLDLAEELDRRAAILHRIADTYLYRAEEPHRAFEFYCQALALDFGNESIERELLKLAKAHDYWEDLIALLVEGADADVEPDVAQRYLRLAAEASRDRMNDPSKMAELFQRLLELVPGDADALAALEDHYAAGEQHEQLAGILRLRLETDLSAEDRVAALTRLGDLLQESLGETEEAESVFRDVLTVAPDDDHALGKLESLAIGREDWHEALDLYEQRLRHTEDAEVRVDVLTRMAQIYETHLESVEEAAAVYRRVLEIDEKDAHALSRLEELLRDLEDWPGLLEVLRARGSVESDTDALADLDYAMGEVCLLHLEARGEAIVAFERALELRPDHPEALAALESLLDDTGFCLEAARVLGPVYQGLESWQKLVHVLSLEARVVEDPDERRILREKIAALQMEQIGAPEDALVALVQALADAPGDEGLRSRVEALADETGAWELLAGALQDAAEETSEAGRLGLTLWRARVLAHQLERDVDAIEAYEDVLAADGEHAAALKEIAPLLARQERWEALADVLERRLRKAKGAAARDLRMELAVVRESQLGDAEGAVDLYQEILWEDAKHERVLDRLMSLAQQPELLGRITALLEPVLREGEEWGMLISLLRVQSESGTDSVEQAAALRHMAEIFEEKLGDNHHAFESYAASLAADPDAPGTYDELVRLATAQGLWPRLAIALEEALAGVQREETARGFLIHLAELYLDRLRAPQKAEAHAKAVVAQDPENQDGLALLQRVYEALGAKGKLREICEQRAALPIGLEERRALNLKIAELAQEEGDDEAAAAAYEAVLEANPGDADALDALAGRYEAAEDWDRLGDVLRRRLDATASSSESAPVRMRLAHLYASHLEDLEGAAQLFEDVLATQPDSEEAQIALEGVYGQLERWDLMRDLLERRAAALTEPQDQADTLIRAALVSETNLEDATTATRFYRRALDIDPDNVLALDALVRLHEEAEDWVEVAELLDRRARAAEEGDERREALIRGAEIRERQLADFDGAAQRLAEVLEVDSGHVPALMALGRLHESQEDWAAATDIYERLLPHCTNDAERATSLAKLGRLSIEQLGDAERARTFLDEAWALDPGQREVWQALARIHRDAEAWEDLKELLAQAYQGTESDTEKADLALELAGLFGGPLQDPDEQAAWLERAQMLSPGRREVLEQLVALQGDDESERTAELLAELIDALLEAKDLKDLAGHAYRLGTIRQRSGDKQGALEAYRLVRKHDASHVGNLLALGQLLYDEGERKESLKVLQALLLQQKLLEPEQLADVFLRLAEICLETGDTGRARQYANRLLRVEPDHARGREIKESLK